MSDLKQRIESLYRSDVRGAVIMVIVLWITVLFVLYMTWPYVPLQPIRIVLLIAAALVLIFNTAAILAMIRNYRADKEFIYGLDIKNADATRNRAR
jgi:predicted neutral ceramidase superfamily lipid hydrolase